MILPNKYIPAIMLSLVVSCTSIKNPFFPEQSAHKKYEEALKNAGLEQTILGKSWFEVAKKSLDEPLTVNLPYQETGYFAAAKPAATGLLLNVKRGEKINVQIKTIPADSFHVFTELWLHSGDKFSLLKAIDTASSSLQQVIQKEGNYILRIQPELLANVEYTVSINYGPSLAFPVDSSGKPQMISFWGAGRDAGARKHEGVDIAAKFRTPALAATGGFIGRVTDNKLGGKVVFLFDSQTQNSLYYAHLDSQIAKPGERVKAGDTVGLVGKTGNAIHTVPHLHFGIYTANGAIDPLPFIDPRKNRIKPVTASLNDLNKWVQTSLSTFIYTSPDQHKKSSDKLSKNEAVFIMAATEDWYKIQLPNGQKGFIKSKDVTDKITRMVKTKNEISLLDFPDSTAAAKALIPKGETLKITGSFNGYHFTEYQDLSGWVLM